MDSIPLRLHAVEQMVCTGLLDRASHPAIDDLFPALRITGTSRLKLHDRIRSGASRPDGREDAIPLRHAVLRIGGREKLWSGILGAMIEGRIRYAIARATGRLVERIDVVRSPDLDAVLKKTFDRADHPTFRFAELMRQRDALELLNVDPTRWQDIARRLDPRSLGPHKTLVVREMLALARRVIDAREAKHRWGVRLARSEMIGDGIAGRSRTGAAACRASAKANWNCRPRSRPRPAPRSGDQNVQPLTGGEPLPAGVE